MLNQADIKKLASLTTLDQLRAQILSLINGPATQLVSIMQESSLLMARVLSAYSQKQYKGIFFIEQKLANLSTQISGLTLLEAAELVKLLEETLGISTAAPMMMAPSGVGGNEAVVEEEKTEFDVILVNGGSNKIKIIKEIRAITG